ncbi:MAG: hypothetical protein WD595_04070 [Waddliaceae bacterium]
MQKLFHSILAFLYPPFCHHCQLPQEISKHLLCEECLQLLQLSQERVGRIATTFEWDGPGSTLLHHLRKKGDEHVAEALASFLLVRWDSLGWPIPDIVTYVPSPWLRSFDRGFTPSLLLAKAMARLFCKPLHSLLQCSYQPPQLNMRNLRQKKHLLHSFSLKKNKNIEGKVVLLIDDFIKTRHTMNQCVEVLMPGFPKEVYGLTVCGTMD